MYRKPTYPTIFNTRFNTRFRGGPYKKPEHIPKRYVDPDKINKLFSILNTGDYNAILEYIINDNNMLNVRDQKANMNPLHAVINNVHSGMNEQQKWNICKKLLDYGVAVNDFDKEGNTPLHLAVKHQLFKIAKLLKDRGADVNSVNNQNQTPLFMLIKISPCKPIKKVGSLIPKPEKEDPDIKKEFNDITKFIMDEYKKGPINKYFKHIKNSCTILDKIFDEDFYINDDSYLKTIIRDLINKIPANIDPTTSKSLMGDISSAVDKIFDDIIDRMPKMLQPMDIKPFQEDGWGPGDNYDIDLVKDKFNGVYDKMVDNINDISDDLIDKFSNLLNEDDIDLIMEEPDDNIVKLYDVQNVLSGGGFNIYGGGINDIENVDIILGNLLTADEIKILDDTQYVGLPNSRKVMAHAIHNVIDKLANINNISELTDSIVDGLKKNIANAPLNPIGAGIHRAFTQGDTDRTKTDITNLVNADHKKGALLIILAYNIGRRYILNYSLNAKNQNYDNIPDTITDASKGDGKILNDLLNNTALANNTEEMQFANALGNVLNDLTNTLTIAQIRDLYKAGYKNNTKNYGAIFHDGTNQNTDIVTAVEEINIPYYNANDNIKKIAKRLIISFTIHKLTTESNTQDRIDNNNIFAGIIDKINADKKQGMLLYSISNNTVPDLDSKKQKVARGIINVIEKDSTKDKIIDDYVEGYNEGKTNTITGVGKMVNFTIAINGVENIHKIVDPGEKKVAQYLVFIYAFKESGWKGNMNDILPYKSINDITDKIKVQIDRDSTTFFNDMDKNNYRTKNTIASLEKNVKMMYNSIHKLSDLPTPEVLTSKFVKFTRTTEVKKENKRTVKKFKERAYGADLLINDVAKKIKTVDRKTKKEYLDVITKKVQPGDYKEVIDAFVAINVGIAGPNWDATFIARKYDPLDKIINKVRRDIENDNILYKLENFNNNPGNQQNIYDDEQFKYRCMLHSIINIFNNNVVYVNQPPMPNLNLHHIGDIKFFIRLYYDNIDLRQLPQVLAGTYNLGYILTEVRKIFNNNNQQVRQAINTLKVANNIINYINAIYLILILALKDHFILDYYLGTIPKIDNTYHVIHDPYGASQQYDVSHVILIEYDNNNFLYNLLNNPNFLNNANTAVDMHDIRFANALHNMLSDNTTDTARLINLYKAGYKMTQKKVNLNTFFTDPNFVQDINDSINILNYVTVANIGIKFSRICKCLLIAYTIWLKTKNTFTQQRLYTGNDKDEDYKDIIDLITYDPVIRHLHANNNDNLADSEQKREARGIINALNSNYNINAMIDQYVKGYNEVNNVPYALTDHTNFQNLLDDRNGQNAANPFPPDHYYSHDITPFDDYRFIQYIHLITDNDMQELADKLIIIYSIRRKIKENLEDSLIDGFINSLFKYNVDKTKVNDTLKPALENIPYQNTKEFPTVYAVMNTDENKLINLSLKELKDQIIYENPTYESVDININTDYDDASIIDNIIINDNNFIGNEDIYYDVADIKEHINDEGKFVEKDGESPFYYISKIDIALHNIKKHYDIIKNNLDIIKDKYDTPHQIIETIIAQLILSSLNMVQNINMGVKEVDYAITKTKDLINFLEGRQINEKVMIKKDLDKIREKLVNMYISAANIPAFVNKIINNLNENSRYEYMNTFHTIYNRSDTATFKKLFDDSIKIYIKLPSTLEKFNATYDYLQDINDKRKKLVEDYLPNVNIYNYQTYYGDNTPDQYYKSSDAYNSPLPPKNYRNVATVPKIGYLVDDLYNTNPNLPYGSNAVGITGKSISGLNSSDNKLGNVGIKQDDPNIPVTKEVYPVIGNYLDDHFYMIKYYIVRDILTKIDNNKPILTGGALQDELKDITDRLKEQGYAKDKLLTILYTISGKIADQLAIGFTNYSIRDGITTYILKEISGKDIDYNSGDPAFDNIRNKVTFGTDIGFNVNYNKLMEELVDSYIKNPDNVRYNDLKYTEPLMGDITDTEQYRVLDQNYNLAKPVVEDMCYQVEIDLIKYLVDSGCKINARDSSLSTVLHIALETLHTDLIREYLNMGAEVHNEKLKNSAGRTPYEHFIEIYNNHVTLVMGNNENNLVMSFSEPIYEDVKKELHSKPELKYNIPDYLNTLFPQLLIMFNGVFYYYMLTGLDGWKNDDLVRLSDDYGISASVDNLVLFETPVIGTSKHMENIDTASKKVINAKIKQFKKEVRGMNHETLKYQINKLIKKLNVISEDINSVTGNLTQPMIKPYIVKLYQQQLLNVNKLKDIYDLIQTFDNPPKNELNDLFRDDNNNPFNIATNNIMVSKYDPRAIINMQTDLTNAENTLNTAKLSQKGFTKKIPEKKYQPKLPSEIYNDAFTSVKRHMGRRPANQPYTIYNELWQSLVNDKDRIINISNPHILSVHLQKMILETEDKRDLGDITKLAELYHKIFVTICRDLLELPREIKDEYYIIKESFNIIVHIVKHILCVHMYKVIIRTISEFIGSFGEDIEKGDMGDYISDRVKKILENDDLERYIIGTIPEKVVKYTLELYEDDYDNDRNIESFDVFFQSITNILTTNEGFAIATDSGLINNLEKYIYPYFKELFQLIIPKMWNVLNNYSRYIQNETRYIDILKMLMAHK